MSFRNGNNNYFGGYPQPQPYYGGYQLNMPQQQVQAIPYEQIPISSVKFATEEEARAFLPTPNSKIMLINSQKKEFYVKGADNLGNTFFEPFTYSSKQVNENSENTARNEPKTDFNVLIKDFIKKEDLSLLATKDDLKTIQGEFTKLQEMVKRLEIDKIKQEYKGAK